MMSYIFYLLSNLFYYTEKKEKIDDFEDDYKIINHINVNDITYVKLNPPEVKKPLIFDKVDIRNLNNLQLQCILNVKLKHTPLTEKKYVFETRHPVLREILSRRKKDADKLITSSSEQNINI